MRHLGLAAGLLLVASSISLAATDQADNVVVGAVNLNKPMGVRQMGAAGVGIGNGGVMAMWSNPACLMDMETKGEFSAGGGAMNDGNESFVALGGGWKFGDNWAVGGFLGNNGTNFKEVDGLGQETGEDLSDIGGVDYEDALAGAPAGRDFAPRSADDHYILYTGGTTGNPKGVM